MRQWERVPRSKKKRYLEHKKTHRAVNDCTTRACSRAFHLSAILIASEMSRLSVSRGKDIDLIRSHVYERRVKVHSFVTVRRRTRRTRPYYGQG